MCSNGARVAKHIFAIAGYIVVGRQETEVIDCIDVFGILDDLLEDSV